MKQTPAAAAAEVHGALLPDSGSRRMTRPVAGRGAHMGDAGHGPQLLRLLLGLAAVLAAAAVAVPTPATGAVLAPVLPVAVLAPVAAAAALDVFVDPAKGSDAGDGSAAQPLRSLRAAQRLARPHAAAGGEVTVHLAAGALFSLAEAEQGGSGLSFSSVDSGSVRWVGQGHAAGRTAEPGTRDAVFWCCSSQRSIAIAELIQWGWRRDPSVVCRSRVL